MKASDGFTIYTVAAGATAFTPVALITYALISAGHDRAAAIALGFGFFGGMAVAAKIETALKQGSQGGR